MFICTFGMSRLILLILFLAYKLKSYCLNTHQPFFLSSMIGNFVEMLVQRLLNSNFVSNKKVAIHWRLFLFYMSPE